MSVSIATYKIKTESKSPMTNVKKAKFNDGYQQIVISGINYDRENINIQFIPMDSATILALETILLNSVNGIANMILYTPYGESTAKYYTAGSIIRDTIQTGWFQISCVLERQFPII